MDRYRYRGYADPNVYLDVTSLNMAQNYYMSFATLAGAVADGEAPWSCAEVTETMTAALPFERLDPSEQIRSYVARVCDDE